MTDAAHGAVKLVPGIGRLRAERDAARRERDAARRERDVARRERDAARRKLKAKARARATRRDFPRDFDEQTREIIRLVRGYTMTGNEKLHAMISATRYVVQHNIEGDFVECGVWRGGNIHAAARVLAAHGDVSRDLSLFDTFEGMPAPTEHDARGGVPAAEMLARSARDSKMWAIATLDDVEAGLRTLPYPAERFHLVPGRVEDTIPEHLPERIALLRLDTDWYASTAHELSHAYDRLSPGGVLVIDDYGDWDGARRATDEFLARTGEPLLLVRVSGSRIAVKPWR